MTQTTRLPLPGCIPENDEINFIAPDGKQIAGIAQHDSDRTWEWGFIDPRDPSLGEYASDGPSADYTTTELRGEAVWHDETGRPWMERHLLPAAAGAQPQDIVALARRDYHATVAAEHAGKAVVALEKAASYFPGGVSPKGSIAYLNGAMGLAARTAEDQAGQLAAEWCRVHGRIAESLFGDYFWSQRDQEMAQSSGWELSEFSDGQICIVANDEDETFTGHNANESADTHVRLIAISHLPPSPEYAALCQRAVKIADESYQQRLADEAAAPADD